MREASLRLGGERPEGPGDVGWTVEELGRVWGLLFWYGWPGFFAAGWSRRVLERRFFSMPFIFWS